MNFRFVWEVMCLRPAPIEDLSGTCIESQDYYSKEFTLDGQLGKIYNNAQFMAKVDFATTIPTSYRFIASISTFDYFKR